MKTRIHSLLLLSGLVLALAPGQAQINGPLPIIWQATYGGTTGGSTNSSWPIDFVETAGGGFIICGVSDGGKNEIRTEPSCNGSDDVWIIKIDAQGQRLWDKSYGGADQDWPVRLFLTADGGFIFGGTSQSDPGCQKSAPKRGAFADYWLVRCDGEGNVLWQETYAPNAGGNCFTGMTPTTDGGYVLYGGAAAYPPIFGWADFGVVKVDSQGRGLWTRRVGSTEGGYEFATAGFETAGGGFIVFGNSEGIPPSGDKTSPYFGGWIRNEWGYGSDSWVVCLDAERNRLWDKTYGGSGTDQPRHVAPAADGGFLMVGPSNSPASTDWSRGTKTCPCYGAFDYWAVRIDAQGNQLWERAYGGTGRDICEWAEPMPDGGWLLAGESASPVSGTKTSPRFGATDFWIVRIDDEGNQLWEQSFGGVGTEGTGSLFRYYAYTVTRIKRTSDGGFLLVGNSNSPQAGMKTAPRIGSADYWVLKLGPEPPSLRGEVTPKGQFHLSLIGPPECQHTIQGSADLVAWTDLASPPNPTGKVCWTDPEKGGHRFYRAVRK